MRFKNIILLIFILFTLNSFYQPIQINRTGNRHTIVRQINFEEDELTTETIKRRNIFLIREFISILNDVKRINTSYYNTS